VHINVQPYAEKVFSGLTIELRTPPQNREVILLPPRIDIVVRGGIRQLASLTNEDFQPIVEYRVVAEDTTGRVEPVVIAPPGIQVVSKKPEKVQYIVRRSP
jgi:hypothetical protein